MYIFQKSKKFFVILFILLLFFLIFVKFSKAVRIQEASDTLSRLKKGISANHTIRFTSPSGVSPDKTIVLTFANEFSLGTVDYTDIDLKINGTEKDLATSPAGGIWGVEVSGQKIIFTNGNITIPVNALIEIEIGTHALHQINGDSQIVNPGIAAVYQIRVDGTFGDSGTIGVIILEEDQVLLTATVGTVLSFTIDPLPTNTQLGGTNSAFTHSTQMATVTNLPFGEQIPNQGVILGQKTKVSTNAFNGYTVTITQDQDMKSGVNKIDAFPATNISPQPWEDSTDPFGTIPNNNTGWLGYTTSDESLAGSNPGRFGIGENRADYWAGFAESNVPYEIAYHNGVIYDDIKNIGFKTEINIFQPAGDYSSVITYICTANF